MKSTFLYIFLFIFSLPFFGQQNLVPNPSFEEYWSCPTGNDLGNGEFEKCKYWWYPTISSYGTSDYFNVCNNATIYQTVGVPNNFWGYQTANSGEAFVGFGGAEFDTVTNIVLSREFLTVKLLEPLCENVEYSIKFYVSLANESSYSVSKLGIYLSEDSVSFSSSNDVPDASVVNDYMILDTMHWSQVSLTYLAEGGEKYLTIGYFEEDVLLESLILSDPLGGFSTHANYYYIDDVSLSSIGESCLVLPNVFTPNNDGVNDFLSIEDYDISTLILYNRWGVEVGNLDQSKPRWIGDNKGSTCSEGVYFYIGFDSVGNNITKGTIQLIR